MKFYELEVTASRSLYSSIGEIFTRRLSDKAFFLGVKLFLPFIMRNRKCVKMTILNIKLIRKVATDNEPFNIFDN